MFDCVMPPAMREDDIYLHQRRELVAIDKSAYKDDFTPLMDERIAICY